MTVLTIICTTSSTVIIYYNIHYADSYYLCFARAQDKMATHHQMCSLNIGSAADHLSSEWLVTLPTTEDCPPP